MRNKKDLHGYQLRAIQHIFENTHCTLLLDMGLGKTISSLSAIYSLIYEELDINTVLIVAPKRVAESVWDSEIAEWHHIKKLTVSKIIGDQKQRLAALRKKADIYLVSRDNIAWLCGIYGGSMLPFDMLVIDELSSFKNPASVRFKALKQVQPSFKRVVGLTGTPAPNGLIDLWSQMYLIDRGERLEKFITKYREKYFRADKRNGSIIYSYGISEENEQLIHAKIKDVALSMKAEDHLKLPGRIDNNIILRFPPDLQERYDEFEEEQVLQLFGDDAEGEISAVNAAVLQNKLLQFANGAIYDTNKEFHVVHDLKIDAVKEIIEDANGKPVLIAWTYRSDMERLMVALKKYKPVQLKTDQHIKDWNAGKIQIMMMHPASGGHGLNLQAGGNIVVWFGQTWSLELKQQFDARLYRQGQKQVVVFNNLIAATTVDEKVIKSQAGKAKGQDSLMAATKALIQKYIKK